VVSALGERVAHAGREGSVSGERCGEPWEGCTPFIGVGGVPGRGGRALMALTPLKALMPLTPLKALRAVNARFEGD
jgi:hypothetical protein